MDEYREMLKRLEWVNDGPMVRYCPLCEGEFPNHLEDCQLASILSKPVDQGGDIVHVMADQTDEALNALKQTRSEVIVWIKRDDEKGNIYGREYMKGRKHSIEDAIDLVTEIKRVYNRHIKADRSTQDKGAG